MSHAAATPTSSWRDAHHPAVAAAAGLVLLQLLLRGTGLVQGWFYGDDLEFLRQAQGRPLSLSFLLAPHDSQLMPGGIAVTWLVERVGDYPWTAAAVSVLVLQALAGTACWAMLCELFGVRWWCLAPLALYLFSPLTLTAFFWWAAALNQVPVQLCFFLVVLLHVRHLRSGRRRDGVLAVAALLLGLACYVKAVLVVLPLLALSVLWWGLEEHPGRRPLARAVAHLRSHLVLWAAYAVAVGGYLAYYLLRVPNPVATGEATPYLGLADTLVRRSLGPALLGGPWTWDDRNPPLAVSAAPGWAVALSWLVLVGVLVGLWRAFRPGWRPVAVVVPYLVVSIVLVARGRASLLGADSGLELRYLADLAPVLSLALGLVVVGRRPLAPAPGHDGPHLPSLPPRAAWDPRTARWETLGGAVLVLALVVGTAVSSVRYAGHWTADFPTRAYVQRVVGESQGQRLELLDEPVPGRVVPGTSFPENLPSRVFAPLGRDRVAATDAGTDLGVLDDDGAPAVPEVTGAESEPGPLRDCGYAVRTTAVGVPMTGQPQRFFWWLEVAYLASQDGAMTITVGDQQLRGEVRAGLHRWYVRGEGPVDRVTVRTDRPGTALCLDRVSVGDVSAVPAP